MASKIITNYLPEITASIFGRSRHSVVTVNLTNHCDQNCIYCELGKNHPSSRKGTLTKEDLFWVIDQMAELRISRISLCGGEPFLFEGMMDVVAYAGGKNIRCTITTNGMKVHKLNDHDLRILKDCKTMINISIDSFRDDIQSITRGTPAALDNALKSIQKLNAKKVPLTVLTVISKYNYDDLSDFLSTAHANGIKQVLFQPIIYYSNYPDRAAIDQKSQLNVSVDKLDILRDEFREILRFERSHAIKTNVYRIMPWIEFYLKTASIQNGEWFFDRVLKKFYCREIDAIIDISYDGGVQPCGLALATISIHENRQRGLLSLWTEATQGIRDDLSHGRYHPYCNGCCHHFSRNMLASVMKNPFQNRAALFSISLLLLSRMISGMMKKIYTRR